MLGTRGGTLIGFKTLFSPIFGIWDDHLDSRGLTLQLLHRGFHEGTLGFSALLAFQGQGSYLGARDLRLDFDCFKFQASEKNLCFNNKSFDATNHRAVASAWFQILHRFHAPFLITSASKRRRCSLWAGSKFKIEHSFAPEGIKVIKGSPRLFSFGYEDYFWGFSMTK